MTQRIEWSPRLVRAVIGALCVFAITTNGARSGQETPKPTPPAEPAATPPTQAPPAASTPKDLLSIARAEANREAASLHGRIKTLLIDLALRTDENDPFVTARLKEIERIGSLALEDLVKAMDYPETDRSGGAHNTGLNASRAIARMQGQSVTAALVRLTREGGVNGRRNAAIAIGLRGDLSLFPAVKELCAARDITDAAGVVTKSLDEKSVVARAIEAIGRLGGPDAPAILQSFVGSAEPAHAAAATLGLASLKEKAGGAVVLERLRAECESKQPADPVVAACLEFFAAHPDSDSLELAGQVVTDTLRSAEARGAAARTLGAVAAKYEGGKRKAISALDEAVKTSNGLLLEQVAFVLNELGDKSGVEAVVAPLEKQIKDDPKNFNLYYTRADIYIRLKEFARGRKDYLEGLKREKEPRQPERVYIAIARCSAAMNEFANAKTYLERLEDTLGTQDYSTLPRQFPEFDAMAKDSKYEKLFAAD